MTRHHLIDPDDLTPARGFSHGALAEPGRTLYIAGQTGHRPDLTIDEDLVAQFAEACRSVARVIEASGGVPDDLVSMTIYTTDVPGYRESLKPIGETYREVFGRHFPPMALIGVAELVDPTASIELVCVAVIPD
jgi:enamine deaminase RidA (YjgF/YER057c/UK114 family)